MADNDHVHEVEKGICRLACFPFIIVHVNLVVSLSLSKLFLLLLYSWRRDGMNEKLFLPIAKDKFLTWLSLCISLVLYCCPLLLLYISRFSTWRRKFLHNIQFFPWWNIIIDECRSSGFKFHRSATYYNKTSQQTLKNYVKYSSYSSRLLNVNSALSNFFKSHICQHSALFT